MSKNKKQKSQQEICRYIYDDYIYGKELVSTEDTTKELDLLIDNGLACKISVVEDVIYSNISKYKIASEFICKYNKSLKKKRRRQLLEYEFGKEFRDADFDPRVLALADKGLEYGTFYADLGSKGHDDYMILMVKPGDENDPYIFAATIYFIGNRCEKFKNKFFKKVDQYTELFNKKKNQMIITTDGHGSKTTKFKPFDKMIFTDKEKIIKYIDNWVDKIPEYVHYGITPKLSILLYGEPGTGKSSFYKALAEYLDIDSVTTISPSYFENTDNQRGRRGDYGPHMSTIYALDDIDCFCQSREDTQDADNSAMLSSLLSFLDTPNSFYFKAKDGLYYLVSIVVAATNYIDRLDEAVKRYGRFDLKLEMKEFTEQQARDMCAIYDLTLENVLPESIQITDDFRISPSYLQALCLEHVDSGFKTVDDEPSRKENKKKGK